MSVYYKYSECVCVSMGCKACITGMGHLHPQVEGLTSSKKPILELKDVSFK